MFIHYVNLDAWRLFGTIKGRRKCPTNNTAFKEGFKSLTNKDSLILQWISERPVAKISKWSHLILCPVYSRTDFLPCSWPCIAFLVDMNTARVLEKVLKSINLRVYQNLISRNDENVQRWSTPLIRWVTFLRTTVEAKIVERAFWTLTAREKYWLTLYLVTRRPSNLSIFFFHKKSLERKKKLFLETKHLLKTKTKTKNLQNDIKQENNTGQRKFYKPCARWEPCKARSRFFAERNRRK